MSWCQQALLVPRTVGNPGVQAGEEVINSTLKYMDIISQGLDNGFSCRADVVNMLNTHAKEAKAKIIQRLLEEHDKSKRRDDQGMEMDRPIM